MKLGHGADWHFMLAILNINLESQERMNGVVVDFYSTIKTLVGLIDYLITELT